MSQLQRVKKDTRKQRLRCHQRTVRNSGAQNVYGREENLNSILAVLAFLHPTSHGHMETYSCKALFLSSSTFSKRGWHNLRILLNTELLTSFFNWLMIVLWNKSLCSPYTSLSLMASMLPRVRGIGNYERVGRETDHEAGKGRQEKKGDSMTVSQFKVWPMIKTKMMCPCSSCNWASGSELPVGCMPSSVALSQAFPSLLALASGRRCLPAELVWHPRSFQTEDRDYVEICIMRYSD